jgi:hypothetical protein
MLVGVKMAIPYIQEVFLNTILVSLVAFAWVVIGFILLCIRHIMESWSMDKVFWVELKKGKGRRGMLTLGQILSRILFGVFGPWCGPSMQDAH